MDETKAILEWIASTLGTDTYVNLMDQYSPAGNFSESAYVDSHRTLISAEFLDAQRIASELGSVWTSAARTPRLKRWMMLVQD